MFAMSRDERQEPRRDADSCRTAPRPGGSLLMLLCPAPCAAALLLLLCLQAPCAAAAGTHRHFELPAGDAVSTLNEFSRQADLQVLFDFTVLKGVSTRGVSGDLDASEALASMLAGTDLMFDFVNDHTLAITPRRVVTARKTSALGRLWARIKRPPRSPAAHDTLEQVLISSNASHDTQPPLGGASIQLSRVDVDRAGLATAQDFLHTLPQVFGGGPNENTLLIGREASTNSARGAGVNLRGLNTGATLVLIDGQRMAPSGTAGTFTDISNIPLSAVDHIDVLPDGASALYGADAIGGVVNFVMRHDFNGAQTQGRAGGVTDGSLGERQLSQLLGTHWDSGNAILALEYYQRDALRASDRPQQTSDLTSFGGTNFNLPYGSPGTITNGLTFWPIPRGQNGTALSAASLTPGAPNLYDQDRGSDITPREQRWSAFAKVGEEPTDGVHLSAEGLLTGRRIANIGNSAVPLILTVPSTNPFYVNPAGGTDPVIVLTGTSAYFGKPQADVDVNTGNFSLGANVSVLHGWIATGRLGYTFEHQHEVVQGFADPTALMLALADPNPATAFNPFGDGAATNPATLAAIARSGVFNLDSNVESAAISAIGPVISFSSGDVRATIGTEYRRQVFDTLSAYPTTDPTYDPRSVLGRRTAAVFGELQIPVIGAGNPLVFARRLELSLGARYEHHSDVGGATAPKAGLLWSPVSNLDVRGTWTRAFRAPNLPDMAIKGSFSELELLPDPASSTGLTTALIRAGTNPDLQAERATSWTLGADIAADFMPGLTMSLTYFNIAYAGRVDSAQLTPDVLERPDLAWLVNRNFTAAQLNDACTQGKFVGVPGTCTSSAIGAIIDNRLRNIALLRTRGIDLLGKYALDGAYGKLAWGLNGTYLLAYSQANSPGSALVDVLNTQNYPIDLRLRGSMSWDRRGLGISTYVNFADGYRDTLSVPSRKVDSWTTVDLQLRYETRGDGSGWLGQMQFALNVQNLLDTHPPFLNNPVGVGYDQENGNLTGRLVSFDVRKRW